MPPTWALSTTLRSIHAHTASTTIPTDSLMRQSSPENWEPSGKAATTCGSNATLPNKMGGEGVSKKKRVLPSLGLHNNAHMFLCAIEPFLDHYGPRQVETALLDACVEALLRGENPLMSRDEDGSYAWTAFSAFSRSRGILGSKLFQPLKQIIAFVMAKKDNVINLYHALNPQLQTDTSMYTYTVDAWFIEGVIMAAPLQARDTNASEEAEIYQTKVNRSVLSRSHVQLQVLGACHGLLSEDPRRMWTYGLTFENSLASVWYFSRSHSVKSFSFDWVKDPLMLLRVLLSFANASQSQLGIDPTVHLGPLDMDGMSPSFIYEVPREDGEAPFFFRTLRSLSVEPPSSLAGRTTRVWEVTQVTSVDGRCEVDGKRAVLKDVWLEADNEPVKTEADNMDALFKAVDDFVDAGLKSEVGKALRDDPELSRDLLLSDHATVERLMTQVIEAEPRFNAFDDAAKIRLRENLTNKKYRSMFLTKLYAWRGVKCRDPDGGAIPFPKVFHSWPFGPDAIHALEEEERLGQKVCLEDDQPMANSKYTFAPRRQHRFIYDEVCTTLQNLESVGEVVNILSQTLDVLHVLFAGGWVHRDISANNIMAYRPALDQPWRVKLADLEYSKPMVEKARVDLRIGTPFFMPVEISSQVHLSDIYRRLRPRDAQTLVNDLCVDAKEGPTGPNHLSRVSPAPIISSNLKLSSPSNQVARPFDPVNHNFQHDLESVWWILVWTVSCRVGCVLSATEASKYFRSNMNDFAARRSLLLDTTLTLEKTLHENLGDVGTLLETLRHALLQHYVTRPLVGNLNGPESYSGIHAAFTKTFREFSAKNGPWTCMRIQNTVIPSGEADVNKRRGHFTPPKVSRRITKTQPKTRGTKQ